MNKIWKRILLVIAVLLVLAIAAVAAGAVRAALQRQPMEVELTGWPHRAALGETVTATLAVTCPWGVAPGAVTCTPGAGMVEYGTPTVRRAAWGWEANDYLITVRLRPYLPGPGAAGKIMVDFSRVWGAPPTPVQVDLDAVTVEQEAPAQPGAELPLAGQLAPGGKKIPSYFWSIALLAAVIAVAVVLWLVFRPKQRRERVLEPWEVAELEVRELREKVRRNQDLKGCLVRLTDVVREYLEWRFALRSTRQTTVEFLQDLHRPGSPLNAEQQQQLSRFMTAADLVKFAGRDADSMLLNPALDQAEALIEETRPVETGFVEEGEVPYV